jgi:phosphoribosylformimino-5-aminoimidazole carboxamide ribotide isomerase
MIIIPAIDLLKGSCVRLVQGDYERETVYDRDPVAVASKWESMRARRLHLVDLDGAKEGKPCNMSVVKRILKTISIPVEIGGGIRDLQTIDAYIKAGVQWVILGSVAVEKPSLVREACEAYPGRIIVGIDARDGRVATRGWLDQSEIYAVDLAKQMGELGVAEIIYTDIARDGMLTGPNLTALEDLARASGLSIIASGGVSSLTDLFALKTLEPLGVSGVIVGKAIYDGRLALDEAVARIEGMNSDVG